jgi:hypothetical protein
MMLILLNDLIIRQNHGQANEKKRRNREGAA